jgi:hypothetical protein
MEIMFSAHIYDVALILHRSSRRFSSDTEYSHAHRPACYSKSRDRASGGWVWQQQQRGKFEPLHYLYRFCQNSVSRTERLTFGKPQTPPLCVDSALSPHNGCQNPPHISTSGTYLICQLSAFANDQLSKSRLAIILPIYNPTGLAPGLCCMITAFRNKRCLIWPKRSDKGSATVPYDPNIISV